MRTERFSPQLLQEIKSRIHLPDLIQRYTKLNRSLKALCPFHIERYPSLSVQPKKQRWHCFGCGRGGDCFSFVIEAEHLTFSSAVKLLAFEAGIRLPESDSIRIILSCDWKQKQKKLKALDCLEDLFKKSINGRNATLRSEIKKLPHKEKRNAKNYLKELLIEEQFDGLADFMEERLKMFEETRRMVRNG